MTPEQKAQIVLDAVSQAGNFAKAVRLLKDQGQRLGRGDNFLLKDGVRDNYYRALEMGLTPSGEKPFKKEFEVEPAASGEEPLEELIARRRKEASRRIDAWRQNRVVKIHLKMEGPWGLAYQGDPHVDDDGTDLDALFTRAELISETPGLFACNVGDNTNNWVGRLERLYANQSTTAREAWRIAEAWLSMVDWLFLVGGNHDCLDMETEVLTRGGWKHFRDITPQDQVFGLNTSSGRGEWQPILKRINKTTDRLHSVETKHLSMRMTPEHRVLMQRRNWDRSGWKDYEYQVAQTLPKARIRIPVSAESGEGVEYPEELIRLTAWFHTDGGYSCSERKYVRFYQSKDTAPITNLLDKLKIPYTTSTRHRDIKEVCGKSLKKKCLPQHTVRVSAKNAWNLSSIFGEKGRLPEWLYDLSSEQFEWFLSSFIEGDGSPYSHTNTSICYGTKQVLGDLQALCHTHGKRAYLSQSNRGCWRLNISESSSAEFDGFLQNKVIDVESAEVWCLIVPLTNFMVRRNGKAYFTGNCWSGDRDPLYYIARNLGITYVPHGKIFEIVPPVGRSLLTDVRHDFKGRSQWNDAFGPAKEAQMGGRCDIYACGHTHSSAYSNGYNHRSGIFWHALRVGSDKIIDDYADQHGFGFSSIYTCPVAIINPEATNPVNFVTWEFDTFEGAEKLTWLREKWEAGKRVTV